MRALCLSTHPVAVALSASALLAACGGAPPPPPAPPPAAPYQALATTPTPIDDPAPVKRYVVLFDGEMPDEATIEKNLSLGNYVAEVGSSPNGIEVALPGVLCTIDAAERPTDVPKHFLPADLKEHGLSEDEARALGETKKAAGIECVIEDTDLPMRGMPPYAEAAASSMAESTGGWIHDPQTGHYWAKATWKASREANKAFAVDRQIRVLRDKDPDTGLYWLGTRGLVAFGRPDLEAFPVSEERLDAVALQLQAMGDVLISEPELADGMTLSLGPVDALLINRDRFAGTLPAGTTGAGMKVEGPSTARLAVVDPAAPQGDLEAHAAFLRRLTVR